MAGGSRLHAADYAVLVVMLGVSMAIGLYYACRGGKQKTTSEFLMADRKLKVFPVALSMFMSIFSAIYILGVSAEMYQYGVGLWIGVVGNIFGYILANRIFVPLYYPLKITSMYQYVDWRFNSRFLRLILAIVQLVSQVSYMGLAMYAPATALEGVTNFPVWATIIVCGVVTTLYATLGGMKAVIWTDVFQGVIMIGGVFSILVIGTVKVGGISKVWQVAANTGRTKLDFRLDPTVRITVWPALIGNAFATLCSYTSEQVYVQRVCALPTLKDAIRCVYVNAFLYVVFACLVFMSGLTVFAYYDIKGCDPLRAGYIQNSNQILPYFVVDVLSYPGLPGLFISTLFSGALSSVSSALNAAAAITWKDLLEPFFYKATESRKAAINRLCVFIFGCAATGMAFLCSQMAGHVMTISYRFLGSLLSPIEGIMVLGMLFSCSNTTGAIIGAFVCIGAVAWVNVGSYLTVPHRTYLNTTVTTCNFTANSTALPIPTDPAGVFWLYRLSYLWVAPLGTLMCILVGIIASVATGGRPRQVDPRLIVRLCDQLCCCLPVSVRRTMWCGVDQEPAPTQELRDIQHKADDSTCSCLHGVNSYDLPRTKNRKNEKDSNDNSLMQDF